MKKKWSGSELAATIDHTLLKTVADETSLRKLCREAVTHRFASVCVNPCWVPLCVEELKGSGVPVCTVIGFPLGANSSAIKAAEAKLAVSQGAAEIDMVMNIGFVKSGKWNDVANDIREVVQASKPAIVKVIIETCYLDREEKVLACRAAVAAGADFVKTSTGFGTGGATVEDVQLMKQAVGDSLKIKASGGIRTMGDAIAMLEAGASRIGASSGIAIVAEAKV
jgi:deoxyribose-phosphate aldolase